MIKTIARLKRKKGMSREEFLYHYEKVHAPLALSKNMPGVRKYVQNHPINIEGTGFDNEIDGISEMWFDDIESFQAFEKWLASSPEAEELRQDSDLFLDSGERLPLFVAEEHTMKE